MNKRSINNLNAALILGEFVFVIIWVFSGYFLATRNWGAFIGLLFLGYGVYGESFFYATKGKIKPIYRRLSKDA